MQTKSVHKLYRYLQSNLIVGRIVFFAGVIFLILYLLSKWGIPIIPNTDGYGTVVALIFFIAFLSSVIGIINRIKFRKQLRELKMTGEIEKVLNDYEHARSMYDGKLKMGNLYAFGKRSNAIIRYADIERVFEYVHYTNAIRDQRMLKVRMKDGKEFELCHLKVFKKRFNEENEIIRVILERNQEVQVGTGKIDEDSV